ncbi:MAG TPA: DUF1818 family protein [Cyanobium sp.]|nr:DUF1818 family protein [Cyanobium sp.]
MQVQEGEGWRLVVDPAREPFAVLIGGNCWAAELTSSEARTLSRGVARLVQQHRDLAGSLMAEERLGLELEMELEAAAGVLWLALEGDRDRWSLRFVLTPGPAQRALEGSWSAAASLPLAAALMAGLDVRRKRRRGSDQHC